MFIKTHTALRVISLYAMVTAVCTFGTAFSARRNNSPDCGGHTVCISGSAQEQVSLKANKEIKLSEQVAARRRNNHGFAKQNTTGNTGDILVVSNPAQAIVYIFDTSAGIASEFSLIPLPGYYAFLSRYTLF